MIAGVHVEFEVPFVRGKERPRVVRGHAYTPAGTEASERLIWTAYCDACTDKYGGVVTAPAGVPVHVAVSASGTMPTSRPKRDGDREPYVYMPDSDNIAKLVLDALNPKTKKGLDGTRDVIRVGAWEDDRQVVRLDVEKVARYRGMPERTVVVIEWSRTEDKNDRQTDHRRAHRRNSRVSARHPDRARHQTLLGARVQRVTRPYQEGRRQ